MKSKSQERNGLMHSSETCNAKQDKESRRQGTRQRERCISMAEVYGIRSSTIQCVTRQNNPQRGELLSIRFHQRGQSSHHSYYANGVHCTPVNPFSLLPDLIPRVQIVGKIDRGSCYGTSGQPVTNRLPGKSLVLVNGLY